MKMFSVYWSKDSFNIDADRYSHDAGIHLFSTDAGYSEEETTEIDNLEIDEVWVSKEYGVNHTIARTT